MSADATAPFEYTVRRSDRARRVRVRVDARDGAVEVVLPRRTPAREAERAVAELETWILRRRAEGAPEAAARVALERWYRRQARPEIAPRLDAAARAVGRPYATLTIRDQRTRWGS